MFLVDGPSLHELSPTSGRRIDPVRQVATNPSGSVREDAGVALPEADVLRIQLWCRERVPEHLWPQLKVEADVEPRHVTIVEVRPPWDGVGEPTRFPIARLRYTATTGQWSIYWRDRNLKFHQYDRMRPTKNVQALLDHVADSGDPIFWG